MNSLQSWAASDLFGAITRVGFWICSIAQAIVAVLPVPVAPSSVENRSPFWTRSTIPRIGIGLIPGGIEVGDDLERRHNSQECN